MNKSLSTFFTGVAAKRLSEVEVMPKKSNQHEFNGSKPIKEMLGIEKAKFQSKSIYVNDSEQVIESTADLTWYDSRENNPDRAAEYRLYYTSNEVVKNAKPGDIIIVGKTPQGELIIIIAEKDSTAEKQVLWLFGFDEVGNKFVAKDTSKETKDLGFAAKYIFETLGIEVIDEAEPDYLEILINKYNGIFPTTAEFSSFARQTLSNINPLDDPDNTLLVWLEREEMLFKTMEKHIVQKKLQQGFGKNGDDVDDFIKFSLSVQNRRKARAGLGFENHLEEIFNSFKVKFTKKAKTERNNTPDFLFPGIKEYKNPFFDPGLLTMLGLKTSAKERWTQVLSEADRINEKHFITLEPAISKNQTDEMIARNVQLVLPRDIISTYKPEQQTHIMTVADFIKHVKDKQ